MKIGLTGSIACGKSTVSSFLSSLGYVVADADAISHSLTACSGAALPAIRNAFGDGIFFCDGTLNRRELGSLVFADAHRRAQLNAILHPMIISEIHRQLDAADSEGTLVFADIPLLYECHMEGGFDQVWVVSALRETQIERLLQRDGLSREEAIRRIDAQMPLADKIKRADAVISTEGAIEDTHKQVLHLIDHLSQRRQA